MTTAVFTRAAPRVPGGGRVDVSTLVAEDRGGYGRAAAAYTRWQQEGWIAVLDGRQRWVLRVEPREEPVVEGLVGALALDAAVHPHERTDEAVAARRAARLAAVPLDLSPVSTYAARASTALAEAIAASVAEAPTLDVDDEAGTRFRMWPLVAPAALDVDLADLEVVVADGHHRVAAAVAARAAVGSGPARTLATVWSRPPPSRAMHRLLHGDVTSARRRLEQLGRPADRPGSPEEVARRIAGSRELVIGVLTAPDRAVPLRLEAAATLPANRRTTVDQVVVHEQLLPRLGRVRATAVADLGELRAGVAAGGLGLLLRPVPTDVVTRVALAGGTLPPKSTSFRPKPRTGLFARVLDAGETRAR